MNKTNLQLAYKIDSVFKQLQWIENRLHRIINAVSSHFGKEHTKAVLAKMPGYDGIFILGDSTFQDLMDESEPLEFLKKLAHQIEFNEARMIEFLRKNISPYPSHVEEQILFGARISGQDAARAHLKDHYHEDRRGELSLLQVINSVLQLSYQGMPEENNYFLSLRPLSDASIHFKSSPHLAAWKEAQANPVFLEEVHENWIRGLLDIFAPHIVYYISKSFSRGHDYGLEHYMIKSKYVSERAHSTAT